MRVWLDDDLEDRPAPAGWMAATTAWACILLLSTGRVVELSLDHDLGDDEVCGRGIDVINWLAEQQEIHGRVLWPGDGITLHTANSSGRDTMVRAIRADAGRRLNVTEHLTGNGHRRLLFTKRDRAG